MKRSILSIRRRSGGSTILLALLFLHNLTIATSQNISDEQRQLKRQQRVNRRQQQRRRRNVVGIGNGIVDSTVSDNEVGQPSTEDTKLEEQQPSQDEMELQLLVTEGENEEQQRLAYFKEHIQQENELLEMEWDTNYVYDVQVSSSLVLAV